MCAAQKARQESSVTLGVQLENGERLMGDFSPGDSLFHVLSILCPQELNKDTENIVAVYMRNEIYGIENLKNTSLRSLGLTGGRAMLRLMHRTLEQLKTQANVSSAIPSKPQEEKPYVRKMIPVEERNKSPPPIKKQVEPIHDLIKREKEKVSKEKKTEAVNIPEPMELAETKQKTEMKEKRRKKVEFPENFSYVSLKYQTFVWYSGQVGTLLSCTHKKYIGCN